MIGLKQNLFATALSNLTFENNSFHAPAIFSSHLCLLPKQFKPCNNEQEVEEPELLIEDADWSEDLSKSKPAIVKKSSYTATISA